jgi:putative ABC transport system substrate-binding protein
MKRREFITLLGGAAAAWPHAARAQQPKVPTTGFIVAARPAAERDRIAAFSHRLRELGWIESRNIAIDFRSAEGQSERLSDLATELVRLKVDVIVIWECRPGLFAAINVVGGRAVGECELLHSSAKGSRTIID